MKFAAYRRTPAGHNERYVFPTVGFLSNAYLREPKRVWGFSLLWWSYAVVVTFGGGD